MVLIQVLSPKGSGLGLYGMNERAELVSGSVNIETKIGGGHQCYTEHSNLKHTLGNKIENSHCR